MGHDLLHLHVQVPRILAVGGLPQPTCRDSAGRERQLCTGRASTSCLQRSAAARWQGPCSPRMQPLSGVDTPSAGCPHGTLLAQTPQPSRPWSSQNLDARPQHIGCSSLKTSSDPARWHHTVPGGLFKTCHRRLAHLSADLAPEQPLLICQPAPSHVVQLGSQMCQEITSVAGSRRTTYCTLLQCDLALPERVTAPALLHAWQSHEGSLEARGGRWVQKPGSAWAASSVRGVSLLQTHVWLVSCAWPARLAVYMPRSARRGT